MKLGPSASPELSGGPSSAESSDEKNTSSSSNKKKKSVGVLARALTEQDEQPAPESKTGNTTPKFDWLEAFQNQPANKATAGKSAKESAPELMQQPPLAQTEAAESVPLAPESPTLAAVEAQREKLNAEIGQLRENAAAASVTAETAADSRLLDEIEQNMASDPSSNPESVIDGAGRTVEAIIERESAADEEAGGMARHAGAEATGDTAPVAAEPRGNGAENEVLRRQLRDQTLRLARASKSGVEAPYLRKPYRWRARAEPVCLAARGTLRGRQTQICQTARVLPSRGRMRIRTGQVILAASTVRRQCLCRRTQPIQT
jgi:hypothetical protein